MLTETLWGNKTMCNEIGMNFMNISNLPPCNEENIFTFKRKLLETWAAEQYFKFMSNIEEIEYQGYIKLVKGIFVTSTKCKLG